MTKPFARAPWWRPRHPDKWTFWRFNWLAHHKRIRALERARTYAQGRLLDVGCGSRPFEKLFRSRVTSYVGVDLPGSPALLEHAVVDAWSFAEQLPIRSRSVDTVLALAMMNNLAEPGRFLLEARRVLRDDGVLIAEFLQMGPPWNPPWDYWRFTRFGAERLLHLHGFHIVACLPVGGLMARVGLSAIAGLERYNRGPTRILTEIPVRLLYMALQLVFEALDQVFFDPEESLEHLIVARRLPDANR